MQDSVLPLSHTTSCVHSAQTAVEGPTQEPRAQRLAYREHAPTFCKAKVKGEGAANVHAL